MKSMAVLGVGCCSSTLYGLPCSINFSVTDVVLGKFQEGNLCHCFILIVILPQERQKDLVGCRASLTSRLVQSRQWDK